MDSPNHTLTQLGERISSMSPKARLAAAALSIVALVSLGYLLAREPKDPQTCLFGGETLSARQLDQIEAAIAQAKLSDYQRRGNRIYVPADQKSVYLAAVADARALPPNFHTVLEHALDKASPLEFGETKRERARIAKQQLLSQIVCEMDWVEDAYVLYDQQQTSGLRRDKLATAVVAVRPMPGQSLDSRRTNRIKDLVVHSIAGMKLENVAITSLGGDEPRIDAGKAVDKIADSQHLRQRIDFEQSVRDEILHAISYIPGVQVQVDADLNYVIEVAGGNDAPDVGQSDTQPSNESKTTEEENETLALFAAGPNNAGTSKPRSTTNSSTDDEKHDEKVVHHSRVTPNHVRATVAVPRDYVVDVWHRHHSESYSGKSREPSDRELAPVRDEVFAEVKNLVEPLLLHVSDGNSAENLVKVEVFSATPQPGLAEVPPAGTPISWTGRLWTVLAVVGVAVLGLLAAIRSVVRAPRNTGQPAGMTASTLPFEHGRAAWRGDQATESQPHADSQNMATTNDALAKIIRADPDVAASILRTWMGKAG